MEAVAARMLGQYDADRDGVLN
eukprot:SAG22_NODE_6328_length_870_cov_1.003891_2_plen_21_part_01